jgi:hypothetical protein
MVAEICKQIKVYNLPLNLYHLRTQDGKELKTHIPLSLKQLNLY